MPHPVTQAAFRYINTVLSARADKETIECELVTTGTRRLSGERVTQIYLRADALDALPLVALVSLDDDRELQLACALAARLDGLWTNLPKLSIDTALSDDSYVMRFLAQRVGLTLDQPIVDAVETSFPTFVGQSRGFGHPLRYLREMDVGDIGARELAYSLHTLYPTTTDSVGAAALSSGWGWPESWGVWSRRDKSSLRLRLSEDASAMKCVCSPFPVEVAPKVCVNGMVVEPEIRWLDHHTELHVPLPPLEPEHGSRLAVDFFVDHSSANMFGLGLCSFTLSDEPPRSTTPRMEASDPARALINSGFARLPWPATDPSASELDPPSPHDVAAGELIGRRSPQRILIVAPDGLAAWRRLSPHCPKGLEVACASVGGPPSMNSPPTPPPDDGPHLFHADFSESAALPPPSALFLDLVHFHDVEGQPRLAEILGWAAGHLAYSGMITGCERSVEDAKRTLGAMIETSAAERLMFKLNGAEWQAFPQAFFRP